MGVEIERKYLVTGAEWFSYALPNPLHITQGYLTNSINDFTVRVRACNGKGYITVKTPGKLEHGEWEYEIPVKDAQELLDQCATVLTKTRYHVYHNRRLWEVDTFHGLLAGLVVAEIELKSRDHIPPLPVWVGEEKTFDERYSNWYMSRLENRLDIEGLYGLSSIA